MAEITDFGPRKTIFILAIVVGCFAVLWPKIFYPMLTASVTPHHTSDNSACCDVFFESDVTAADIMNEICQNILKHHQIDPRVKDALRAVKLTPQSANLCKEEILARCAIDLSTFLAERERLGKSYKQVLEEIRSFNSSLCLKLHFGIPLSQLGIPHLIRYHILMPHSTIKQERRTPPHAGGLHPAMRERGRAIPSSHIVPKVSDRPDHIVPKMRPPLGGAGHVVPAQKGNGTMGIIMPLYTLGIILFFLYTIVKVLKKSSDSEIISEYPGVAAEKEFRKMVFSPEAFATAMSGGTMHYQKERSPSPERPPTIEELKNQAAGDIEIDQLRRRLVETEAAMERIVVQMGNISRSVMHSPSTPEERKNDIAAPAEHSTTDEEVENIESPTVKVMGMEMTASCEGKGSRPTTPIIPISPSHIEREKTPPIPIYLEGALPPQCELLVTDSETHTQKPEEDVEAPVVLSGKMTLSLISLDQNAAESEEEDVKVQREENAALDTEEVLNSGIINVREEEREIEIQDEVKEICEETQPQAEKEEKSQEEQSYKRDKQDKISYDEKREMVRESEEEVEETEAAEEEEEEEVEEIEESEQVKAQTEENQEEEEEVEVEMEEEEEVEVEEEEEAEEEEVVEEEEEEEVEVDEEEEDVNEENKDVEELEEDDEGVKQESEEEYEDEADEEDEDEEEEIENSQKGKDTRRGM
ncbi:protein Ycf2-like isoform X1 [Ceratina calcarata]|uniref:Protein Ycf2-like isoform X1 n=1 Tax=Ceratina calcarata TaxID=156304 RepID=A0AAJ7JB26_9HYME|nr:protein Ycf2-like isoform X1 [Ceratina calcarata]